MTQKELNKIPPPPREENLYRLPLNQTKALLVDKHKRPQVTITLRRIEGGTALVQITFDAFLPDWTPAPNPHGGD